MAISTGLRHRFGNSLPWACPSLFPPRGVAKPGHGLGSISLCERGLCQGLVVPLWLKGLTWTHPSGKKSAGGSVSACSTGTRRNGGMGVGTPDVLQSLASSSSSSAVFQVGMLSQFLDQWRSITSNRFVLNMVQVTIFSLGDALPCSVTSSSSL